MLSRRADQRKWAGVNLMNHRHSPRDRKERQVAYFLTKYQATSICSSNLNYSLLFLVKISIDLHVKIYFKSSSFLPATGLMLRTAIPARKYDPVATKNGSAIPKPPSAIPTKMGNPMNGDAAIDARSSVRAISQSLSSVICVYKFIRCLALDFFLNRP